MRHRARRRSDPVRHQLRLPWKANSLEWAAPSPPPHGNFETVPTVYRGPYEFSDPEASQDYLPQFEESPGDKAAEEASSEPAPA
ncbi:MAG: hypothetical protein ACYTG4_09480 [Planctomycetota bacterium]